MDAIVTNAQPKSPDEQAKLERAERALAAYTTGKQPGPVPRSVWLGDGYVEIFVFNRRLHLACVFVMHENRRTGLGSKYLKEVLAVANEYSAEVELSVQPVGPQDPLSRMGKRDLKAWYKRHGFVALKDRPDRMVRQPVKDK